VKIMDKAVIKYYRELLISGFNYAGSIENPSIFLDPAVEGENRICTGSVEYMNIYVKISENTVEEIKYLCICNPTANVAIEAICKIINGKNLLEAVSISEERILEVIGSFDNEIREKVTVLLEILRRGLERF
jgi:NifU-like protein involved in Fe-S cluster formation